MTSHSKIAQFNWECIGRLKGWNNYVLTDDDSEIFQTGFKHHVKDGIESCLSAIHLNL